MASDHRVVFTRWLLLRRLNTDGMYSLYKLWQRCLVSIHLLHISICSSWFYDTSNKTETMSRRTFYVYIIATGVVLDLDRKADSVFIISAANFWQDNRYIGAFSSLVTLLFVVYSGRSSTCDAVSSAATSCTQLRARKNGVSDSGVPTLGLRAVRRLPENEMVQTGPTTHAAQRRDTQHDCHCRQVTWLTLHDTDVTVGKNKYICQLNVRKTTDIF